MEPEIQQQIEEAVRRILSESDTNEVTESKIRKQASNELQLDLSEPLYKALVKQAVQSFLEEQAEQEHKQNEEKSAKEYDDDGDLIICRLSDKRRVTIQDFRAKTSLNKGIL